MMDALLTAIVDDDRIMVKTLLESEPSLALHPVDESSLYEGAIFHWLYVGDTALHLAAAGHRVEITRLLLAAGANPNANSNHRRSSPVHYAADGYIIAPTWNAANQIETLRLLCAAGANVNAQDMNGATPLHRAVRTHCAAAVTFLLSVGADPRQRNKSGSTPFHLAVQNTGRGGSGDPKAKNAQRQIIEEFLAHGIETSIKDGKGKSVLDCVRSGWIRDLLAKNTA